MSTLTLVAAATGLVGVLLCLAAWRALRDHRLAGAATRTLAALLCFALALLGVAAAVGVRGYRALTYEEAAADVHLVPSGPQQFQATVRLPDGRVARFDLAGDQLYVDARIIKWKPFANLLGLHTAYELDRIGGRYALLADEQQKPRTVYSIAPARRFNLFAFVRRHPVFLSPIVDAQYGSGTFAAADTIRTVQVRVSTSGLLIRPIHGQTLLSAPDAP